MIPEKPLGRKNYGSIPHILGSRLGPSDSTISEGQSKQCTDKVTSDHTVWCQTKLDGSNVGVAKLEDGSIVALGRAGFLASSANYEQHQLFDRWVRREQKRFDDLLDPGERLVGEWLAQAHGTVYNLQGREPFVAFDIMVEDQRMLTQDFYDRIDGAFEVPDYTFGPIKPEEAIKYLDNYGASEPEGVVYRVERIKSKKIGPQLLFLAKWVHADKIDGKYFNNETWNWRFEYE